MGLNKIVAALDDEIMLANRVKQSPPLQRVRQTACHTRMSSRRGYRLRSVVRVPPSVRLRRELMGVTWQEYETGLENQLTDLHVRVHRGTYRAQPSRRVYLWALLLRTRARNWRAPRLLGKFSKLAARPWRLAIVGYLRQTTEIHTVYSAWLLSILASYSKSDRSSLACVHT